MTGSRRFLVTFVMLTMIFGVVGMAHASTVMLYSSMQEDQLLAIKRGFEAAYPDITMEYYFAGTGRVMTKIATEAQAGTGCILKAVAVQPITKWPPAPTILACV